MKLGERVVLELTSAYDACDFSEQFLECFAGENAEQVRPFNL